MPRRDNLGIVEANFACTSTNGLVINPAPERTALVANQGQKSILSEAEYDIMLAFFVEPGVGRLMRLLSAKGGSVCSSSGL